MRLSNDGQVFWAWRRTVTGWHLGIGADIADGSGQPDAKIAEWLYDAPGPPPSAPSTDLPGWSSMWDDTPPNWH